MERNELEAKLLEMPEKIRAQTIKVTAEALNVEKVRSQIAETENEALAVVLAEKEKYTNDKARKLAQEQLLKEDANYQNLLCGLCGTEGCLKEFQIELDFLHNTFKALLAIAGMGK